MTISSTTDRVSFEGNGVTTSFPLPFRFFSNGDIQASLIDATTGLVTDLSLGVDYTLLGAGAPEQNGSPESALEMVIAPATGKTLFVQRVMDIVQPTDIVNQGRFFPEVHETVFDRLTMLVQQAALGPSRTIRVPESDPIPGRLPSADARATKVFGFDENGDPVVSSLSMSAIEQQPLLAQEAAANAVLSAEAASGFADASLLSAENSGDSALLAQKWAENPEDDPVVLGKFSAFHWATKAMLSLADLVSRVFALESRELPLGQGQTWQLVTSDRAISTIYTNTHGRTIVAAVGVTIGNTSTFTSIQVRANSSGTWVDAAKTQGFSSGAYIYDLRAEIPAGHEYRVTGGSPTLNSWRELR